MIRILGIGNSLITGLQGAGKSHFIISQINLILQERPDLTIYLANVDGVTLTSPNLHLVQANFSWVDDASNDSVIIYDEAGTIERFNNSSTRINSSKDVQTLTMARHQGKTIVFIAQDSSIVHPAVRKLLTRHFHFSNPYNDKKQTHCFVFPQVQDRLDGQNKSWQNNAIEEFKHELDPSIFPLYKSVDDGASHNKIKQTNAKAKKAFTVAIISAVLIIPVICGGVYLALSYVQDTWTDKPQDSKTQAQITQQVEQKTKKENPLPIQDTSNTNGYIDNQNQNFARTQQLYQQRLPPDYQIITTEDALRPAIAIKMGNECSVYNAYGDLMNYSFKECNYFLQERGRMPKARSQHTFVSNHPETPQNRSQTPQNDQILPTVESSM